FQQELSRSITAFSNFAISFGCLSILSGLTPLYGTALQSGGTIAVTWGWLIVALLTMFIGLSLAEICSAFPTTGGLYFWVSRLATKEWVPLACWLTGWFNWLGLVFAITSTDLSLAQFMTGAITIVNPSFGGTVYIQYGIFALIVILHGMINSVGVRLSGIFNQVSVWWHVLGTLLIIVVALALTPNKASPAFVFGFLDNRTGFENGGYAFLLGLLQSQYTLSGYDAAAHMSEETKQAQKGSPFGILVSIASATIVGWAFLLAVTFCVQDYQTQIVNATYSPAMVQVFMDGVGQNWSIVFCVIIMGGMFFCGSALTLGSSRMVYAFSRDGAMPMSGLLHTLHPKTQSPVFAVWFNIVVALIIGIPFMFSSQAFNAIVSVNTIASSVSYLIPILLRITLARDTFQPGPFNLGKFSVPVGIVASCWISLTSVLFICPTEYPITTGNMNFAVAPFVIVIGISSGYFAIWGRKWFKGPVDNTHVDDSEMIMKTIGSEKIA
ncbi:amino acid/polyamine transporter I, partial [Jimgerdemannia flammicorona]